MMAGYEQQSPGATEFPEKTCQFCNLFRPLKTHFSIGGVCRHLAHGGDVYDGDFCHSWTPIKGDACDSE